MQPSSSSQPIDIREKLPSTPYPKSQSPSRLIDSQRSSASRSYQAGPSEQVERRPSKKTVRWKATLTDVRYFQISPTNVLTRKSRRQKQESSESLARPPLDESSLNEGEFHELVRQKGEEFSRFYLNCMRDDSKIAVLFRKTSIATIQRKKISGPDSIVKELRRVGHLLDLKILSQTIQPTTMHPPSFLVSLILGCLSRIKSEDSSPQSPHPYRNINLTLRCLFYLQKDENNRWFVKNTIQDWLVQ